MNLDNMMAVLNESINLGLKKNNISMEILKIQKNLLQEHILFNFYKMREIDVKIEIMENISKCEEKLGGEHLLDVQNMIQDLTNKLNIGNTHIENRLVEIGRNIHLLQQKYNNKVSEFEIYDKKMPE